MSRNFVDRLSAVIRLPRAGLGHLADRIRGLLDRGAPAQPVATAGAAPMPDYMPAPPKEQPSRLGLRDAVTFLVDRAHQPEPTTEEVEPPAPVPAPADARFDTGRFTDVTGAARDYRLYVPASAAGAGPRPMVLMLHGCGQDPDDFARGTRMNAAAEAEGVIVLYPGQPKDANPKRCWNWFRPEDQRRDGGETGLLVQLAREIVATENVDPDRVYVAGLSAGGAQAMNLATLYPELFAAVGVHSGLASGAARDVVSAFAAMSKGSAGAPGARPIRTIVFQGDDDRTVNPANATAVAAQAIEAAGPLKLEVERGETRGRAFSRALHRDSRGATLCETWMLHGAGHAWSGGDPAGSYAEASGPDATQEMLRFFLRG